VNDVPDIVGADAVAHRHLARVEIDLDRRDARCPTECGVGVAGVALVVERDAG
jgi:hypothetical protein